MVQLHLGSGFFPAQGKMHLQARVTEYCVQISRQTFKELKWTPKTGQSNKLLLAVHERGNHGAETEVP